MKKTPKVTSSIDHLISNHVRSALLVDLNGTAEKQKDELVAEILSSFQRPENWPLTDAERCSLMRRWYHAAQTIQRTSEASK